MTWKPRRSKMTNRVSSILAELDPRERIFVKCRMEGMTIIASAQAAGYSDPKSQGYRVEHRERVQKAILEASAIMAEEIGFTRRDAHDMLLQAYQNADTASEQIQAVRELVNLHGLAKPKVVEHEHKHEHNLQLEHLSTEKLMELADMEDLTLEGEYEVIHDPEALLEGPESADEREHDSP